MNKLNNHQQLYLSNELSDVTLVIDDTEIPAHRSILSERSEYFRRMFSSSFREASSDKVLLGETNLTAFKVVLKYIYTGSVTELYNTLHQFYTFDPGFEILVCAQYYMVDDMVKNLTRYLRVSCTSIQLLNLALVYSFDDLILHAINVIQDNSFDLIIDKKFDQMSPVAVEHVLKVRFNMQESTIFEALVGWMRANPDKSDLFGKFLEHIDLYLLEEKQLDILYKPTQLIDPVFLQNLLNQQREQAKKVQKVENRNVINGSKDLRIVDGIVAGLGFSNNISVQPSEEKNYFIIDLKQKVLLNCLKLKSSDDEAYTVAVSTDMRDWECIDDHSKNESGLQVLHFGDRVVRFFRIEAVDKNVWFYTTTNIEALFLTSYTVIDSNI